ncbi:hypothetical protein AJ88_39330 [Mesorhizobium amorphae CCBAU 01583]|nr:hypothetical protein AJ88_39330 [Mesorhizobium amorphae CCBAU 01583]
MAVGQHAHDELCLRFDDTAVTLFAGLQGLAGPSLLRTFGDARNRAGRLSAIAWRVFMAETWTAKFAQKHPVHSEQEDQQAGQNDCVGNKRGLPAVELMQAEAGDKQNQRQGGHGEREVPGQGRIRGGRQGGISTDGCAGRDAAAPAWPVD